MKDEETVLRQLVDEIVTPRTISRLRGEKFSDAKEAIMAIAEVVASDQDPTPTREDIVRILSLLDYIDPKDESKFASHLLFPTEKERQEYIRVRRRRIFKNASRKRNRKAGVKARVNKDAFDRAKKGEKISPLTIFQFFGDD